ncbi:MAG TPA: hypothetical protein VJ550_12010 [Geomonas sp.]|nr:hypothetical protein [Geomonas sp.]
MNWKYHSTNPPEHSGSYFGYWDMYDWYYGCGKPKKPNAICMGEEVFHGALAMNSDHVLTGTTTLGSHIEINLVDNYCERDLGTTCCSKVHTVKTPFSADVSFDIQTDAVIPIPIESITFDQNPVQVTLGTVTTMKGYINLASEAKIDTKITNIQADSLNVNAIPRIDTIVIPKGSKTGSFDIDVNTNGLSRNQAVTAGISAFYTNKYSYSLTIQAK